MTALGPISASSATPDSERARLQSAVRQLQGVFVEQLLKAMRETVPDEGVVGRGSGEEIFNGLLDQKLASLVPEAWQHSGLEASLLRQLHATTPDVTDSAATVGLPDSTRSR